MVSELFFYQLVLIALLWLCCMLHWVWPSDGSATSPTGRVPPACGSIPEACLATIKRTKRSRREGRHGIPVALSRLAAPSKRAVRTHIVCAGSLPVPLPIPLRAHTPTGCGHGGTRYRKTSLRLHTWSVNPAAIAGVQGRHNVAEPLPLVLKGWGRAWRKLAWGSTKL